MEYMEQQAQMQLDGAIADHANFMEELGKVLKWALPLAERAIDDHRLERLKCGHVGISGTYPNGVTYAGIYQDEVDKIVNARAIIARLSALT